MEQSLHFPVRNTIGNNAIKGMRDAGKSPLLTTITGAKGQDTSTHSFAIEALYFLQYSAAQEATKHQIPRLSAMAILSGRATTMTTIIMSEKTAIN